MSNLKIGDCVILTKSIYDDGDDYHPPGYLAKVNDIVTVKDIRNECISVMLRNNEGSFLITPDEYKTLD